MRAALLARILPRVMKEGESKEAALILMKNSHFDCSLQSVLSTCKGGTEQSSHRSDIAVSSATQARSHPVGSDYIQLHDGIFCEM